jgi:hypothetical protein
MSDRARDLTSGRFVIERGSSVEQDVRKTVEKSMKQTLGLTGNQKLPADVSALISSAAVTAASKAVELQIATEAERAVKDIGKRDVLSRFTEKAKLAEQGLVHISQSSEVDQILKKRAQLLAAKKTSLENAGFTSTEAMSIILADIEARSH